MESEIKEILAEHFNTLPKVVQNAITSSNVEEKMQIVAKKHNLHLDQWIPLENEVMMTLLGIQPIDKLAANIAQETNIPMEMAETIAQDASEIIFEPIRKELERELEHPNAEPQEITPEEKHRQEMLAEAHEAEGNTSAPQSVSSAPSTVRTTIEGDPYREPVK